MNSQEVRLRQKAIESLVENGFDVLKVIENSGVELYFIIYKWQENYFNSAQSIEFNTVEGINITEFLEKNLNFSQNNTQFIGALENELERMNVLRLEFSKNAEWYKWSSVQFGNNRKIVKNDR